MNYKGVEYDNRTYFKKYYSGTIIFRKWAGKLGGIIALFPEIPATVEAWDCMSYEHVGQHGAATPNLVDCTVPATEEEYAPLKRELESIGYDLAIVKRFPRNSYQTRINEVNAISSGV